MAIAFGAFTLGDSLKILVPFAPRGQVEAPAAFEARGQVFSARAELTAVQAKQNKLQDRIANEYVGSLAPTTTRPATATAGPTPAPSPAPIPAPTPAASGTLLNDEAARLVEAQRSAVLTLATAEREAERSRSREVTVRSWLERAARTIVTVIAFATLAVIVRILVYSRGAPLSLNRVFMISAAMTFILVLARELSWVAAVGLAVVAVVLLVRSEDTREQ